MKATIRDDRFWILAACVFGSLVLLNYLPVLVGKIPFPKDIVLQFPPWADFPRSGEWQKTPDIGDIVTSFYPYRAFAAEAVSQGTLPLWNPYISSGAPFVGNTQSALFYPLNIFFYVFPLTVAWSISILLRMFLAAIFMALFVRSIGASTAGTIVSGILFASCGFMTAWQGQPMSDAAIWLPMICYAVRRLSMTHSCASLVLAALSFAMPVLAGHPETAAHLTLTGMFLGFVLWVWPESSQHRRFGLPFAVAFGIAGLLALGVASIQILPTLEWIGQVGRGLSVPWPTLPRHDLLGLVSRDVLRSPNSSGIPIPEGAAYIGMISIIAASLAPFHRAKRYVAFLSVLGFVSFATAYSIKPVSWLVSQTPVISSLKNGRLILVGSFALAALAGLGISAVEQEEPWTRRHRRFAAFALALAFVFSFYMVYRLQRTTEFRVEFSRRPSFSRALLFVSVIPIGFRLYGRFRGSLFPLAICGLAAIDMGTFSYGYIGFSSGDEIFPRPALFQFLAEKTKEDQTRLVELWGPYPNNAPMMYGIASADGYELCLQSARNFCNGLIEEREDSISFVSSGILSLKDRRLDMLRMKYIVIPTNAPDFNQFVADERFRLVFKGNDTAVFENNSVLPRAFIVPAAGIEIIPETETKLERLRDLSFDPEKSVILSGVASVSVKGLETVPTPGVEITHSYINGLVMQTQSPEPGILVISQIYYPGWKATIDGNDADVFPANLALTGIAVPAGIHEVRLVFRPDTLRIGVALTVISLLILAGLIVRAHNLFKLK